MECEKFDVVMMVLVIVLLVALAVMYVFIAPFTIVLFGIAVQCVAEDLFARFIAYISAIIGSVFIGYSIANLIDCQRKDKENE